MVDAAGAIALHVAVTSDRRRPCPWTADVAAQQQHVDDLADHVDSVLVLADAISSGSSTASESGRRVGGCPSAIFSTGRLVTIRPMLSSVSFDVRAGSARAAETLHGSRSAQSTKSEPVRGHR